jgi:putative nucleotidyltransferase with HDIG domain
MTESFLERTTTAPVRRRLFLGTLLAITALTSLIVLLMPYGSRQTTLPITVGDVAGQDVLAPRALSFTSDVLTAQRQEDAVGAVADVYGPPDANVAREQVDRLRAALDFIGIVRNDAFATAEQKQADLSALQNVNLGQENASALLTLSDVAWDTVEQESIAVLEQVMRSTIRQDRLEEARRSVPALVSLSIPESQATLAATLAQAFVAPNSFFSESLTEAAQQQARTGVEPVVRTYLSGETVVQRGQVVTEADLEVLEAFGLVQGEATWRDYVGTFALIAVLFTTVALYLRFRSDLLIDLRGLALVALLFVAFLLTARFSIVDRTVMPYVFPIAGFALLTTTLYSAQAAVVFSLVLTTLMAYNMPNAQDLMLYHLFGSLIGIFVLNRARRMFSYFVAGGAITLASGAIILAYRLPLAATDLVGMFTLLGAAVLNGFFAASLTIVLQFVLAQLLGLSTTIQLLELARPDHPLLQFILRNAPGTYQHSLQIANLAEQAAEAISADALLTRVGSLYHDAGKARHPHFFIENQVPGSPNPHDELSPIDSANVIIKHVPDGVELATKHHLPRRLQDFILEHHGTMITRYQYAQALEAASGDESKVDREDFRYPGPRPQSRETALVMLADGSEARTRAERPKTREELDELVGSVIEQRLSSGQLDDTRLTMRDLKIIQDSFVSTLRGVYHPRLAYPKVDEESATSLDVQPAVDDLTPTT